MEAEAVFDWDRARKACSWQGSKPEQEMGPASAMRGRSHLDDRPQNGMSSSALPIDAGSESPADGGVERSPSSVGDTTRNA